MGTPGEASDLWILREIDSRGAISTKGLEDALDVDQVTERDMAEKTANLAAEGYIEESPAAPGRWKLTRAGKNRVEQNSA